MNKAEINSCCCGSGRPEGDCCGPLLAGLQRAETAEALMRSRYCAYVKANPEYLLKTWHPDYRPGHINLEDSAILWQGLEVVQTQSGQPEDTQGMVEFIAYYEQSGQRGQIHERSRFQCLEGQWLYLDGDIKSVAKTGRNDPCPCGSGNKYKRCCGR